jgi:hypothetical protein
MMLSNSFAEIIRQADYHFDAEPPGISKGEQMGKQGVGVPVFVDIMHILNNL